MVNDILREAGVKYAQARYKPPLPSTYAVYMDDQEGEGADLIVCLIHHSITIEVYESKPDDATEQAIEAALNRRGIQWTKQARYWLQEEQRYQVIYEFNYIEKRRITNG